MPTPAEIRALNEELFRQLDTPGESQEAADAINDYTRMVMDHGQRVAFTPIHGYNYSDETVIPEITLATYANPFMWGRPSHTIDMPDPVRMRTLRAMILVWGKKYA
jgi:hypothetical protein